MPHRLLGRPNKKFSKQGKIDKRDKIFSSINSGDEWRREFGIDFL